MEVLPLSALRVSPLNPRKRVEGLDELAASIKAHGVLQPVLVRPCVAALEGITHEVIAGQRRYLACGMAGVAEIPVIVRELPDDEVLELGLTENLQRGDMHPLEERDAIYLLIVHHGRTPEILADHLGKDRRWVAGRIALQSLSPASEQAFRAGKFPIAHAQVLATLDAGTQAEAMKLLEEPLPTKAQFVRELSYRVLRRLDGAPFDVKSASLGCHPCADCRKRSGTQTELFGDEAKLDRCLDAKCWEKKAEAHWEEVKASAKKRSLPVLSATESKKVFASGYGSRSAARDSGYLAAGETVWLAGQSIDVLKLAKKADVAPVAVARDQSGVPRELYDAKTIGKLAAKETKAKKSESRKAREPSAEQLEHRRELEQAELVAKAKTQGVVVSVETIASAKKWDQLRDLLRVLLTSDSYTMLSVLRERGVLEERSQPSWRDEDKVVAKALERIKDWSEAKLFGLLVEVQLANAPDEHIDAALVALGNRPEDYRPKPKEPAKPEKASTKKKTASDTKKPAKKAAKKASAK